MATDVYYNGVQLHNVVTREWDQQSEYDASGTDLIANHYKLRFEGVLHAQVPPDEAVRDSIAWIGLQNGAIGNTAIEVYQTARRLLGQPRGTLNVTMDGESILFCRPAQGNINDPEHDVDNGPKPRNVSITHVAGASVFRVSFSIECSKVECWGGAINSAAQAGAGVLSNRWAISEEMDEAFFTTRTIRGKLRISASEWHPAWHKHLTIPFLEDGFRRERMEFAVSEDGLTADYSVTDKQVHTAAPFPACKIDCTHTESTMTGVHFISEVNVRLEGPPHVSKRLLIQRAIQVMFSRLRVTRQRYEYHYLVEQCAIIDHIGERNIIEAVLRIRHFTQSPIEFATALRADVIGKPLENLPPIAGQPRDYDRTMSPIPAAYGYIPHKGVRGLAAAILFRCYVQSPCDDDHNVNKHSHPVSDDPGEDPDRYTPEVLDVPSPGDLPTTAPDSNFSSDHAAGMYTIGRMESRYITDSCRTQMPIAAKTTGSEVDASADTSVVFTLAAGQCRREMRYEAERVGTWPMIPDPKDTYTDGALKGTRLKHWTIRRPPSLSADGGQKIFHLQAYYLYALNRPPLDNEATNVGVLPYTSFSLDDTSLTSEEVHDERLGP